MMKSRDGAVLNENRKSNIRVRTFGDPSDNKGWVKCFSSSIPGRLYYFNIKTGCSTWILPVSKNVHLSTFKGASTAKKKPQNDETMETFAVSDFEEENDENSPLLPTFNHATSNATRSAKKRAEVAWKLFRTSSTESPSNFLQKSKSHGKDPEESESQLSEGIEEEGKESQVISELLEVSYSTGSRDSDSQSGNSTSEEDDFDEVSNIEQKNMFKLQELKSISYEDFKQKESRKVNEEASNLSSDEFVESSVIEKKIENSRRKLEFHDNNVQSRKKKSETRKRQWGCDSSEESNSDNDSNEGDILLSGTFENSPKKMKLSEMIIPDPPIVSEESSHDENNDTVIEIKENSVSGNLSVKKKKFSEVIDNPPKKTKLDIIEVSDSAETSPEKKTDDNGNIEEQRLKKTDIDDDANNFTQIKDSSLVDHPYAIKHSSDDNFFSEDSNDSSLHPPSPIPEEPTPTPCRKIKELFGRAKPIVVDENKTNESFKSLQENDAKEIKMSNDGENDSYSARQNKDCSEVNQKNENSKE